MRNRTRTLTRWIREDRGVATSLIEAITVIAIISIVAAVATSTSADRLEDGRWIQADSDLETLGLAVLSFIQDNGAAPAFKSGRATGAEDEIYRVLETMGEASTDGTSSWPAGEGERDLISHHLVRNLPGGAGETSYPRVGEWDHKRHGGWNGPYQNRIPSADPWGGRYLINVQFLTPQGIGMAREELSLPTGARIAVFALSAGPDRTIETDFSQISESFEAGGDDLVFRIH